MAARASDVEVVERPVVLVPVSGGFDSALSLALAVDDDSVDVIVVHFSYRSAKESVAAAEKAALMHLLQGLSDEHGDDAIKEVIFETLPMEVANGMVWPARNMIMLSVCVGLAQSRGADYIYFSNLPSGYMLDSTPMFVDALNVASNLAYPSIHIEQTLILRYGRFSPFYATKAEIIGDLNDLGVDTTRLWSCFDPVAAGEGWQHCGTCSGCTTLKQAHQLDSISAPKRLLPSFADNSPAPDVEE